jgi:hypothetical protein
MWWLLSLSWADPGLIPVQGFLTDEDGAPMSGTRPLTFALYGAESGGVALWSDSLSAALDAGRFSVALNAGGTLDFDVFAGGAPRWIGVSVGDAPESARVPLGLAPAAAWASRADTATNAAQLGGVPASSYLTNGSPLAWGQLSSVPSGFSDNTDNDTTYTPGAGLTLTGTSFALNPTALTWSALGGIPTGFSDGTDNDTTYSAGAGLALTGTSFALNPAALTWSALGGIPTGFSDGTDNDTTYSAGSGLALTGTSFALNPAALTWSALGGIPSGFSDNTDNDTTYSAGTGLTLTGGTFAVNSATIQQIAVPNNINRTSACSPAGALGWDATASALFVCNGSAWTELGTRRLPTRLRDRPDSGLVAPNTDGSCAITANSPFVNIPGMSVSFTADRATEIDVELSGSVYDLNGRTEGLHCGVRYVIDGVVAAGTDPNWGHSMWSTNTYLWHEYGNVHRFTVAAGSHTVTAQLRSGLCSPPVGYDTGLCGVDGSTGFGVVLNVLVP